ncbi:MAG: hypothetical protein AB1665_08920 [Candidatus Thermoplasmatota archaeon]
MDAEVEFGEVSAIYRQEQTGKVLTKVPDDLFERLNKHITALKREAGESHGTPRAMLLLSEAKKLSDMGERIKDRRERKIVIHAQARADPSTLNLTTAERRLFEGLVRELDAHRAHLEGRAHAPHEVCAPQQAKLEDSMMVLQVLRDVGEFATEEHTYHLRRADIVTLPRSYGEILVKSGSARVVAP